MDRVVRVLALAGSIAILAIASAGAAASAAVAPAPPASAAVAPAPPAPQPMAAATAPPTPATPNLMFDQIDRTIVGNHTPPPPGSFAAELDRIKRAASGQNNNMPSGPSLGSQLGNMALSQIPIIGNIFAGNAMKKQMEKMREQQEEMLHPQQPGVLTRYAFYNGWTRVEVPGQYATIKKPDLHQTILLDLVNKTYTIVADAAGAHQPAPAAAATPNGSGDVQSTQTWTAQDARTLEGLNTNHYETGVLLVMSQGNGPCQDGMIRASETEYIADMPEPLPLPQNGLERLSLPAGCNATITHHGAGDDPGDRFYIYRLIRIEGGSALAANAAGTSAGPASIMASMGITLPPEAAGMMPSASAPSHVMYKLSVRSNIKMLGPDDAALFSPPADFTQTK